MKKRPLALLITLLLLLAGSAVAQTRIDNPYTYKDGDFMFMSKHNMDGTSISELGACIAFGSPRTKMAGSFKQWITDISDTAALKMYNMGRCDVLGYVVEDKPGRPERTRQPASLQVQC